VESASNVVTRSLRHFMQSMATHYMLRIVLRPPRCVVASWIALGSEVSLSRARRSSPCLAPSVANQSPSPKHRPSHLVEAALETPLLAGSHVSFLQPSASFFCELCSLNVRVPMGALFTAAGVPKVFARRCCRRKDHNNDLFNIDWSRQPTDSDVNWESALHRKRL
jgi:hypothetical protein